VSKFKRHTQHIYTVKNQNGFNNAMYDYFGVDYVKKEIREMVQSFPTKYPVTISIIDKSFECGRVYIDCVPINEIYHYYLNGTFDKGGHDS